MRDWSFVGLLVRILILGCTESNVWLIARMLIDFLAYTSTKKSIIITDRVLIPHTGTIAKGSCRLRRLVSTG